MKFYEVKQNSDEWFKMRLGVATASCFSKIITPKEKKYSKSAEAYMDRLIGELMTGQPSDKFPPSYWMERGAQMEGEARALYEFDTGYGTKDGGFMTTDNGRFGCSVDARVFDGENMIGGTEIKCPAPWTHASNIRRGKEIDPTYIPQVQGQIYVGGLEFVDWFSYFPGQPPTLVRCEPDKDFQSAFAEHLARFEEGMLEYVKIMKDAGAVLLPSVWDETFL